MIHQKNVRDLSVYANPFSARYWRAACMEVKNLRTLLFAAIIIAIRVALKEVFIPVGDSLSIYCGFIFTAIGGSVYGPVLALFVGTCTDLLGYAVAPNGAFNPLFTLVEVLATFLYGLVFYRQKITFGRILLSKASVNLFANIILQSSVMAICYGKALYVYVIPRVLKNIVMLPFEVILLTVLFGAMIQPMIRLKIYHPKQNALILKKSSYILLAIVTVLILALAIVIACNYDACKTAFVSFFTSFFQ